MEKKVLYNHFVINISDNLQVKMQSNFYFSTLHNNSFSTSLICSDMHGFCHFEYFFRNRLFSRCTFLLNFSNDKWLVWKFQNSEFEMKFVFVIPRLFCCENNFLFWKQTSNKKIRLVIFRKNGDFGWFGAILL